MRKHFSYLLLILITPFISAATGNVPEGGRSAAMGNASAALTDFWSLQNNQAGLAFYHQMAAGIYFENRFLVKELSLRAGGVVMPVRAGVFGLNASYFGYELYNESKIGLGFARKFGERFAAGLQLDYLITALGEDYGSKGVVTFEAGILTKINDHLNIGAHVFNPVNVKLLEYADERVPAVFKVGAAWSLDANIVLTAEVEKETDFDPVVKFGAEYRVIEEIYVRGGISTNPGQYSFGFGLNFKKLKVDFASSVHQVLGWSPQISLIYSFR
ncbi:MAG TPA: hypothetical protein PLI65_09845 [Bacteroidales bacterium]|nr:hypothetical protein [Bacteroidales bacterium]